MEFVTLNCKSTPSAALFFSVLAHPQCYFNIVAGSGGDPSKDGDDHWRKIKRKWR